MADFDPDKFIAERTAQAKAPAKGADASFDPDAFIARVAPLPDKPKDDAGIADAAMRGVTQGWMPFADEAVGAVGGLYDYAQGKLGNRGEISLSDAYHTRRDSARKADAAAEEAHKGVYTTGQIAGGVGSAFIPGAGALNVSKGAKIGEILGKGAAMGALFGAGNAKEITDVPEDVVGGALTGAVLSGGLHYGGKALGVALKKAGPLAAKVLGGVDEATLQKYAANPERINQIGAAPDDAVKDAIDAGVKNAVADKTDMATRAQQLEDVLNQAYAQKQAELVGTSTPLSKAKAMSAALGEEKTALHEMSKQADAALDASGVSYSKKDLLRALDKIGKGAGDAIGDETTAALAKLQTTRDRIATQLPDEIPAKRLRYALQQIRKDINFDQASGEFNDELSGMRKEFTSQISNALKQSVPEYANIMSTMADRADNLSQMNRFFGDESRALGSLETLRKGGTKAQLVADALKNHASVTGDEALAQHLAELEHNQAILEAIRNGADLRPKLFPKAWNALQEAQSEAQMASDVASPIERLTQNRTQSVIRNQGGKVPNIEDRRALEALSKTDGFNYPQLIEDRNVADAFKKGQTNGSRMAVMGGTSGGALGYFLGGAPGAALGTSVGSFLGGTLDKFGPAVVKGTVDSAQALRHILNDSVAVKQLGPYARLLLEAAQNGNKTLAAVNQQLLATDPVYRGMFQDPHQPKRDAIKRRLGE